MPKKINTQTKGLHFYVRVFGLGVMMGFFLQAGALTSINEARLIRPVPQKITVTKTTPETRRQQRIALRILRRKILESANIQGLRSFTVADAAPLHLAAPTDVFPAFDHAVFPFSKVPNWGAMHSPKEWNRTYTEMTDADFVAVPPYALKTLLIPMNSLVNDTTASAVAAVTAKLFYSTRYFGAYDLDAGEFTAVHPGIDLKVAPGTPVGAVGGGRVASVRYDEKTFGLHVLIEHRLENGEKWVSLYGHLSTILVKPGDAITPGQIIGTAGMTGNASAPHLHLQIERLTDDPETHQIYWPATIPTPEEAALHVINPITFIAKYQ